MLICDDPKVSRAGEFYKNFLELHNCFVRIEIMEDFRISGDEYRDFEGTIDGFVTPVKLPIGDFHGYFIGIKPRKNFTSNSEMLIAIAHEFIHIEQYEHGLLEYSGSDTIWRGELWPLRQYIEEEYRAFPWEIEAYDRQFELFMEYLNSRIN